MKEIIITITMLTSIALSIILLYAIVENIYND